VTSSAGGPVTRISERDHWDDKPRWSPDGKIIYYVSGSEGIFNVWGVAFDAASGKPTGKPFRVTSFDSPGLAVGDNISDVEFSLVHDKFVLTMEDRASSIWVLANRSYCRQTPRKTQAPGKRRAVTSSRGGGRDALPAFD